jgi:hypothetical protein
MAVTDLSHLPRARADAATGEEPEPTPRWAQALAEAWYQTYLVRDEYKIAHPDARMRHSDAGKCSWALAATMRGAEPEPMTIGGVWNVTIGQMVHDAWQAEMAKLYPDGVAEAVAVHEHDGRVVTAGHADFWIPSERICFEGKTVGGYGYKTHVGAQGDAQGPMWTARLQGALNALALDADLLVVMDWAKENISANVAKKAGLDELGKFCAEWVYPRSIWEPWARAELKRIVGIVATVEAGDSWPVRYIPMVMAKGAEVIDPVKGRWEARQDGQIMASGSAWTCGYCDHKAACVANLRGES